MLLEKTYKEKKGDMLYRISIVETYRGYEYRVSRNYKIYYINVSGTLSGAKRHAQKLVRNSIIISNYTVSKWKENSVKFSDFGILVEM